MNKLFAAFPVNVIDSILITEETNTSNVLAEWRALDPGITVYGELLSGKAAKLFINWSDQNGTIVLHQGDYFTFVIPDIFDYALVHDATDVEIKDEFGAVVATYSICDNEGIMKKEVKLTFTEYVETHTDISGNFWILLFVGKVTSTEDKNLEFIIDGDVVAQGEVTINPKVALNPKNEKDGYSHPPEWGAGGYYIFQWAVYFNMTENAGNGFNTLNNFSFDDSIPADSPHIFLTDAIRQELGILSTDYLTEIGEYTGADSYPPGNRYPIFYYHYNSTDADIWYNKIAWHPVANGLTTVGIDGNDGLNVSGMEVSDKLFSANLGTITRPTVIKYYTISTIKLAESALGDSEVVRLFKDTFKGSTGEDLSSSVAVYRFEAGGSAQGLSGDHSFVFTKISERGPALPGAMFSLYTSEDFSVGAERVVYSGTDGVVDFRNLPVGTFYIQETITPYGYVPNDTIYKVELNITGFEIYYGDNYENKLSDLNNKIVNSPEIIVQPVSVTLTGTKHLTGRALSSGMFQFVVRGKDGAVAATGTNDAIGSINCSEIEFDEPGVYAFTVEEVRGSFGGVTYDISKFTVTVTVTDDGSGKLTAEVAYPAGGVVFDNAYAKPPAKPCKCYARATKCRKSIEGRKIWIDNDNADNTRPLSVEILLLRDGEVYQGIVMDSADDGDFVFCCLPIWKNSSHKYNYQIDEAMVPDGYVKTIEGYNVINTFVP